MYVYSCVAKPDAKTARLRQQVAAAGGVWQDVARLPEPQLAQLIRQDEIDILVELTGEIGLASTTCSGRVSSSYQERGMRPLQPLPLPHPHQGHSSSGPAVCTEITALFLHPPMYLEYLAMCLWQYLIMGFCSPTLSQSFDLLNASFSIRLISVGYRSNPNSRRSVHAGLLCTYCHAVDHLNHITAAVLREYHPACMPLCATSYDWALFPHYIGCLRYPCMCDCTSKLVRVVWHSRVESTNNALIYVCRPHC